MVVAMKSRVLAQRADAPVAVKAELREDDAGFPVTSCMLTVRPSLVRIDKVAETPCVAVKSRNSALVAKSAFPRPIALAECFSA